MTKGVSRDSYYGKLAHCIEEDCTRPVHGHGLCRAHLQARDRVERRKLYAARKLKYYRAHPGPPITERRVWWPDEDEQVLAREFPDVELASRLNRSLMAVQIRRVNLMAQELQKPMK